MAVESLGTTVDKSFISPKIIEDTIEALNGKGIFSGDLVILKERPNLIDLLHIVNYFSHPGNSEVTGEIKFAGKKLVIE